MRVDSCGQKECGKEDKCRSAGRTEDRGYTCLRICLFLPCVNAGFLCSKIVYVESRGCCGILRCPRLAESVHGFHALAFAQLANEKVDGEGLGIALGSDLVSVFRGSCDGGPVLSPHVCPYPAVADSYAEVVESESVHADCHA